MLSVSFVRILGNILFHLAKNQTNFIFFEKKYKNRIKIQMPVRAAGVVLELL
jgi:hypothetical protein